MAGLLESSQEKDLPEDSSDDAIAEDRDTEEPSE